jgi:hypothetical protein
VEMSIEALQMLPEGESTLPWELGRWPCTVCSCTDATEFCQITF